MISVVYLYQYQDSFEIYSMMNQSLNDESMRYFMIKNAANSMIKASVWKMSLCNEELTALLLFIISLISLSRYICKIGHNIRETLGKLVQDFSDKKLFSLWVLSLSRCIWKKISFEKLALYFSEEIKPVRGNKLHIPPEIKVQSNRNTRETFYFYCIQFLRSRSIEKCKHLSPLGCSQWFSVTGPGSVLDESWHLLLSQDNFEIKNV